MRFSFRPALFCLALTATTVAPVVKALPLDHLRTADVGLFKVPHKGQSAVLVIPHRVRGAYSEARRTELEAYFETAGGPGTFRHYWHELSLGRYEPIPVLVEPVLSDTCPIDPSRPPDMCRFGIDELPFLAQGGARAGIQFLLETVRDRDGLDLGAFDINGDCDVGPCPDGFFDGIVIDTDMSGGVAFPLAAFENDVTVARRTPAGSDAGDSDAGDSDAESGPDDAGENNAGADDDASLSTGIVALVPPEDHEYGHVLGFMDLYGGPTVACLMAQDTTGLSAFSRIQIGWESEVVDVVEPGTHVLAPILDGGTILKFGSGPRYVLVENRDDGRIPLVDDADPGLYFYSVDERQLPTTLLGFLDVLGGGLYLPNKNPPYLNIAMPLNCSLAPNGANRCRLRGVGAQRDVDHAELGLLDFHIEILAEDNDGTRTVAVRAGPRSAPDAGPPDAGQPDAGAPIVDAGTDDVDDTADASCGSCAGGPRSALLLLPLLALWRRRRAS